MTYRVVPLRVNTDLQHFVDFAGLYEMLIDNFIDHEKVGQQLKDNRKEQMEKYEKWGIKPPITTFVVYNDSKAVGYGQLQPHFLEEEQMFETHCYAFIFTVNGSQELEEVIHKQLMSYAKELAGQEVIFYFVDNEEDIHQYLSWGGILVDKEFTYEFNVFDADIPKIEFYANLPSFKTETVETPSLDKIKPFVEVYNLSKQQEPKENGSESIEPKTAEELMELFSENEYESVITLGWYNDQPVALTHYGLTEFQNFVYQRFTGVHPEFSGEGIGTAIKASAMLWVMDYHPEYTRFTAEVQDKNKAMIKVNNKLGFKRKKLQATIEFNLE